MPCFETSSARLRTRELTSYGVWLLLVMLALGEGAREVSRLALAVHQRSMSVAQPTPSHPNLVAQRAALFADSALDQLAPASSLRKIAALDAPHLSADALAAGLDAAESLAAPTVRRAARDEPRIARTGQCKACRALRIKVAKRGAPKSIDTQTIFARNLIAATSLQR